MTRIRSIRPLLVAAAAAVIVAPAVPTAAASPGAPASAPGAAASAPGAATSAPGAATSAADARTRLPTARGFSFGSRVGRNPSAGSGRTAFAAMCTRSYPRLNGNFVAQSQDRLKPVADLTNVGANNRAHRVGGNPAMTSKAIVQSGSLLDGKVQFEGLKSFSRVVRTPNGFQRVAAAKLAKLKIGGIGVNLLPGNRTQRFGIPGGGEVAYNLKGGRSGNGEGVAYNLALRVKRPDGTKVQLARSNAKLSQTRVGIFRGGAWGTEGPKALGLLQTGRSGFAPMPCPGTDGEVRGNEVADTSVPDVQNVDLIKSKVFSQYLKHNQSNAVTKSLVFGASLGGGVVKLDGVFARAGAFKNTRGQVTATPKTAVAGLTVDGNPQEVPAPGETLEVPGVAKIERQVVDRKPRGLQVTALRITLLDVAPDPVVVDVGNAGVYIVR